MSTVYFHFGEGETLGLRGMERAAMDFHVRNIAIGVTRLTTVMSESWDDRDAQQHFGRYLGIESEDDPRVKGLAQSIALNLGGVLDRPLFSWKGKEISTWSLGLNTALAVGSDPIRLCAKIHATCEIHGFFEGKDRDWFAGLIEEGLEERVFRKGFENSQGERMSMGWTELTEQLRKSDEHPVVMSFSVTDGFPDPPEDWRPEFTGDERWGQWAELDSHERFYLALAEIRKDEHQKPIGPETLRKYRFAHDLSMLDLMANDIEKIEKSLGLRE